MRPQIDVSRQVHGNVYIALVLYYGHGTGSARVHPVYVMDVKRHQVVAETYVHC